jgi:hypothetical protein
MSARISVSSPLDGLHYTEPAFLLPCTLGKNLVVNALIDSGARGGNFMDVKTAQLLCQREGIEPVKMLRAKPLSGFNGYEADPITEAVFPSLQILGHSETLSPFLITNLDDADILLGMRWMEKHGVMVDTPHRTLHFLPGYCDHSTVRSTAEPVKIIALQEPSDSLEVTGQPASPKVVPTRILPQPKALMTTEPKKALPAKTTDGAARVCMIGAVPYRTLARQKGAQCFQLSIKQIYTDEADEPEYDPDSEEILKTLPKEHHEWVRTFLKRRADELPPHRPGDHKIELQGKL